MPCAQLFTQCLSLPHEVQSEVFVPMSSQPVPRFTWWRFITATLQRPYWSLLRRWIPVRLRHRIRLILARTTHRKFHFSQKSKWASAPAAARVEALPRSKRITPQFVPGINLYGYLSRWLGLGECARLYARALLAAEFPVSLHDVDIEIPHARQDDSLAEHFHAQPKYARDLIFVNPDHWSDTLRSIYQDGKRKRYLIGYWFWELEEYPAAWLPALEQVDEIMVSSAFVERALSRVTDKPVTRVPLPMALAEDSGLQRRDFGLADSDYIFYCSFDFNSMIARKNPLAAIKAFCAAFPDGNEKVCLLIKSFNGDRDMSLLMQLAKLASRDRRIILRDDMLQRADLQALHRCVDVHVSLHRSEGFGLGMAEAMCMGKPVIATAYSGNMDYMTPANSCLVNFKMVPVAEGEYHHGQGQCWADPDPRHAARHMRALYEDRELGARMGVRAAADMARNYSVDACMRVLAHRLHEIDSERQTVAVGS